MMEAARTSEMLVNFYQTTWRYNPEDSHVRTHRRENLKSYQSGLVQWRSWLFQLICSELFSALGLNVTVVF
jgi:hypothetical protein